MSDQIELATILLTDLVGSTRLATAVGPVRADQLRDEHFALLREAVEPSGGTEVKNTGDGMMVAFRSASAAVRCAVEMQQLFERRYRRSEQQLHVRIGLGAGESTVKDGDYFGMPSIEAARLCDRALPDGILVSGAVRMLAGRCEGVEFESVGELELKGFEAPVEAFAVSWAPLAEESGGPSRWQLPAALRSVPAIYYVGRETERALIERAGVQVRGGARRAVLLSGEPGIGKTRLASYAALAAHGEGFAVCWGQCSEELAVPYEPWIEVCSQLVEHAPEELLARYVERYGGELGRLARNLARRIPCLPPPQSADPETERFLLFSAVSGLVLEVCQSAPVCVVLDDLHWADGQSVALFKHLVRTVELAPVQLIATYRDSDLGSDHPLSGALADLRQVEGVQRMALRGLAVDEVAEILSTMAGHKLDRDGLALAGQIATETDGNPFFVAEIVRSLSESGTLRFDEAVGRWRIDRSAPFGLPESVREVIERRVGRLDEEARELLALAAVIGRSFQLELLGALVEIDESRLLDQLEAGVAASVLEESTERVGEFRFVHALINQTLYEALGPTRRSRIHHRIAQALEQVYGENPEEHLAALAFHWRLATATLDNGKAADYARRAGEQALKSLAPAEAVKLFGDAVELLGETDSAERCRALIGLGRAQRLTGEGYGQTLLEASRIASLLADPQLAATAALANSRGSASVTGEVDAERLAAIERALELDDASNPARRSRLLSLQAAELGWDPDVALRRALSEEAISLARQSGNARALTEALRNAFYANWSPDTLARRAELADEITTIADGAKDPALRFGARIMVFHVAVERGQLERAQAALAVVDALARDLGRPALSWFATYYAAAWKLLHGDLSEGERLAARAFQLGQEAGQPDAIFIYNAQLVPARLYRGHGEGLIGMIEESHLATSFVGVAWRSAQAQAYSWLDRRDEAAAIVAAEASDRFGQITWAAARNCTLTQYADAAVQVGDTNAAAVLYEQLEPWADQVVWTGAAGFGHVRMYLGLLAAALGRHKQADEHLAFACQFHETNGLLLWSARTHLGWAQALADREHASACEHAARALELAREHGYVPIEARATAILEAGSPVGS